MTKCLDIFNNTVPSGKPERSKDCRDSEVEAVQYRDPSFMAPVQPPAGKKETLQGMPVDFTSFLAQRCQG